ncbi:MAG: gliding motility protein GldC [Microscillaceae bacterium]|nr:gliding motility protein GldC [Microscillaceae bacterium]
MKKSIISIEINLDENNIPNKILWSADDAPLQGPQEAKAFTMAVWDPKDQGTLKIDLWNKEMEIHEMKQFVIETISGLADTIRRATSDDIMALVLENACKDLSKRLEEELKQQLK